LGIAALVSVTPSATNGKARPGVARFASGTATGLASG
jgi:hypothetical protein